MSESETDHAIPSEVLNQYIRSLTTPDLTKILSPIKARLLSEETVLHFNLMNFSVEQTDFSITVNQFLEHLGPVWQKWIYSSGSEIENHYYSTTGESFRRGDSETADIPDFVTNFIEKLSKDQKRSLIMLGRDGLLTDESFLNVFSFNGFEKIQVSMKKTIDVIGENEQRKQTEFFNKSFPIKLLKCCHLSSGNFDYAKKSDLDVRSLMSGRQKMPIYFTILFALMTFLTFITHLWSNITNYVDIQKNSLWLSVSIVVFASLLIGTLMYLVFYIVGFLFCCESNLRPLSATNPIVKLNRIQLHFNELHQFKYRIYATRIIQFILIFYTMLLAIYAHEYDLNIYPALTCILSNGFGLMLFMRITHFLHACRRATGDKSNVIYAT